MEFTYSVQAEEMLDKAMDELEAQLHAAERRFESDGSFLEIKSKYANCNDMAVLGDILAESKRITDELYASYEALIRAANSICKPFADEGVTPSALERVVKFMKHINSECSTLGSNFNASVNDYSFGNIASTRYSPSAEARMIETNWKLLHSMHPLVAEETKRREEAAAKARAEREERERIEREKAIEEYPQKLEEWKVELARVTALREKLFTDSIDTVTLEQRRKAAQDRNQRIKALETEKVQKQAEMQQCQLTIANAKFFEIPKKLEANNQYNVLANEVFALDQKINELRFTSLDADPSFQNQLKRALEDAKRKIEKDNPLPREPRDPNKVQGAFASREGMTAVQAANMGIKEEIYETLRDYGTLMTISDIMEHCPACADISNQRCSALVRQLVTDGIVERVEERRLAYFRALED